MDCVTRLGKHNTRYQYCISKKSLPLDLIIPQPNQVLGSGRFGVVLSGKLKNETSYDSVALKIIPLDTFIPNEDCGLTSDPECRLYTRKNFDIEVKQSKLLSDYGITPRFIFSDVVDLATFSGPDVKDSLQAPEKIGVILMEEFGQSLKYWIQNDLDLFLSREKQIKRKVFEKAKQIYDLDYFNMDMHFGNILYDSDKNDVRLLDVVMEEVYVPEKMDDETFYSVLEDMWENDKQDAKKKRKNRS
jgi:hypothetical protein